ncbi:MAG TPA: TetR/AcrR family transcriptional regulator [Chloroflexota bacterium]
MTPTEIVEGRTARKRKAIVEAATSLFLQQGYDGTSMDQVAGRAAVSKQTVYKQFADKERLFADVILGVSGTVDAFVATVSDVLVKTEHLEHDLQQLARIYIKTVMQPRVVQLRRLLIAQASRFPDLGRSYYERGPERVTAALAARFEELAARGLLLLDNPLLAAQHFAFLVLSIPLDKALICEGQTFSAAELEGLADAGVRVFLAAYGRGGGSAKLTP